MEVEPFRSFITLGNILSLYGFTGGDTDERIRNAGADTRTVWLLSAILDELKRRRQDDGKPRFTAEDGMLAGMRREVVLTYRNLTRHGLASRASSVLAQHFSGRKNYSSGSSGRPWYISDLNTKMNFEAMDGCGPATAKIIRQWIRERGRK